MENKGILYALSNVSWKELLKCGVTSQLINKRIGNIQTGNPINCEIVYITDNLLYPYYYERLLKKRLEEQRYNREFYTVDDEEITKIYEDFNVMNKILNTEELILLYIKENDGEYYKKIIKKNKKNESSKKIYVEEISNEKKITETFSFDKRKKRNAHFVNTDKN